MDKRWPIIARAERCEAVGFGAAVAVTVTATAAWSAGLLTAVPHAETAGAAANAAPAVT